MQGCNLQHIASKHEQKLWHATTMENRWLPLFAKEHVIYTLLAAFILLKAKVPKSEGQKSKLVKGWSVAENNRGLRPELDEIGAQHKY